MISRLKQQKSEENKANEQLYENIHLLTLAYPPTSTEFGNVFKKDMFVKNNKAAFHQIVYYLLRTLNPSVITKKITTWPIYEIRIESQFRNEVIKYVNELNNIYEDANVPTIMTSHLISPGGYKFVKFMLKLSQLVLKEHLKKEIVFPNTILNCIEPSKCMKVTENNMNNMKLLISKIKSQRVDQKYAFDKIYASYKIEEEDLLLEINLLKNNLPDLKIKLETLQSQTHTEISDKDFASGMEFMWNKLQQIEATEKKFACGKQLVDYLAGKDCYLEYNVGDFKAPQDIAHMFDEHKHSLDLIVLLEVFIVLLERRLFELKSMSSDEIERCYQANVCVQKDFENLVQRFDLVKDQYVTLEEYISRIRYYPETVSKTVKKIPIRVNLEPSSESLDSTLAYPLDTLSVSKSIPNDVF